MAEPIVMNPQHPVESHFREFLQPQHNNSKARYDKFESSKLLAEKDANELLHKRIQNSKAKKASTQHMGKTKDFPLESYMVPPQFQRNNYYIDQYHHPHHNLQPVHPPPPFYSGHVEKMQPTILPQTQHDKLQNGYNVGMHQQSNPSPLHHEKITQDNGLETKSEINTGKRPPSPRELDNTAKKANFDLDVSDLNASQDKDDELDKILPLIMGDKWAELGTELNLEMFNDSVWEKTMEKAPSPDAKDNNANNSSDNKQAVLTTMATMSNNPQGPMTNPPGAMNNNPQGGANMSPQGAPGSINSQSAPVGMNPGQGTGIINGIKTENEPSPLSKIPPPNVTISPNNGATAPPINRTRASSLNSPQLMNTNNHIQGLPTSQPNSIQPNTMKKEQQSPHQTNNSSGTPNPQIKQTQPQLNQINNTMNQQQMVNQQHLSQQQINQLNHHHQQQQHLMSHQISQQMQKQLSQQNSLMPKHLPISSLNNSVSIGSMVTTSPALSHRAGTKPGGAPQGVNNAQYLIQNPRSPLTQIGQQPGKTSPHTAVSHPPGPHPTGPSQDTSMLNRSSVPNVTVTTGYRPNGNTPEEDRMATVQRQQVKNALHQKIKENALQGQNNKQKLQNEELHRVQSFGAASVSLPQNLVPARMAFNNQAVMQQQGQYPGNMMNIPRSQFAAPGGYTYDRNYHYILQQQQQQHMMQQQQLYYQQMRASDPNLTDHQGMPPGWAEGQSVAQQQYIQRQQMLHQQQQQHQLRLQQHMYQQSQQAGSAPLLQSQVPPVAKTDGLTSKSEGDLYNRTIMGMQARNVVCTMPQRQLHPNSPPVHHPQHPGLPGMIPSHDMQYNTMIQQQQQLGMNSHPSHPLHMSQQAQTMSRLPPQQQPRPDQQQLLHQQHLQQQTISNNHTGEMAQQMTHPTLNDVSKFAQQNAMSQQNMMKGPNIAQTSALSSPTNKQELSESPFNPSLFNSDFTEDIDSFLQGFDMTSFDR